MIFKKHEDKVAILGKGASKYNIAPILESYNNKLPIWTLNEDCYIIMSETENLHFELHEPRHHTDEDIHSKFKNTVSNYNIDMLQIITHSHLPLDEIVESFKTNFICNTLAHELALALYLGYKTIYLFGVDLFINIESGTKERLSVEFWIGVAKGLGVKVIRPRSITQLFKNPTQELIDNFKLGEKTGKGLWREIDAPYLNSPDNIYK